MVQIHSISILTVNPQTNKPVILAGHWENDSWSAWLYKDTIKEFTVFFSKLLTERVKSGNRMRVEKDEYVAYVHSRYDGIVGVVVTDQTYPERVAFDILRISMNSFQVENMPATLKDYCMANENASLKILLKKYQNPVEADKMLKLKNDLEEVKTVMHETMTNLLKRGEDIDQLIETSEELSGASKEFYKKAKKTKGCCVIS